VPVSATTRSRREWRLALALGCAVSLFLLLFHRTSFSSSDETGLYEITHSLATEGDLTVPPIRHSYAGRDGRRYSHFAVGQAVLALPLYALGGAAEATLPAAWVRFLEGPGVRTRRVERSYRAPQIFAVLLYPPLATGALVAVFFVFERRLHASRRSALVAGACLGTCSYAALHGTFFLRHTTEALLVLAALLCFFDWRERGGAGRLVAGSLLASALLLVRVPATVYGVGLAGYLAWAFRDRARRGELAGGARLRAALAVALPFAAAVAVHLALNQLRWGTWLESPMVAQRGMFGAPALRAALGLLLSPGAGLLAYTPLLLLAPAAGRALARRHAPLVAALVGIVAVPWVFVSAFEHWHGLWTAPGPRYLFAAVPLWLLPLGPWLDGLRSAGARALVAGLAGLGGLFQVALMATHWTHLVTAMGYRAQPGYGFLFRPEESPIAGALLALLQGAWNDLWLVQLARGWPGQPGRPDVAAALFVAWLVGVGLCARALLRRAPPGPE